MQKLSDNYGKTIKINRQYYTTDANGLGASQKVGHAVADLTLVTAERLVFDGNMLFPWFGLDSWGGFPPCLEFKNE